MKDNGDIEKDDGWFAGEDQNLEWDIRDEHGAAVDITGWTMQFRMASTKGGASILTKSGTQVLTSRVRVVTLIADTIGLTNPFNYYYTLSRTDSGLNNVLRDARAYLNSRTV